MSEFIEDVEEQELLLDEEDALAVCWFCGSNNIGKKCQDCGEYQNGR